MDSISQQALSVDEVKHETTSSILRLKLR